MKQKTAILVFLFATFVCMSLPAGSLVEGKEPSGPIVERNIDLAAEKAIDNWLAQLEKAPGIDNIKNIGILALDGDIANFTELLSAKLTALQRFRVVILRGRAWNEIEEELARTDPDAGFGDIMDKASIKWREVRGDYALLETALGADAILLGRVRQVDADWLRARVRIVPYLAAVETRAQIGGGIAEGESVMSWQDLAVYYKTQIFIGIIAFVALLILLMLLRGFVRSCTRPR